MKKLVYLFVSLFLVLGSQNVNAQSNPEETASAQASATIIKVIEIVQQQNLLFGNIIADADGGSVEIKTNDDVVNSGINFSSIAGERKSAIFKVTGEAGVAYALTLPSSILIKSGDDEMTVEAFKSNSTQTLSSAGEELFNVGATLLVGVNQAPGSYSGSFDVKVAYN